MTTIGFALLLTLGGPAAEAPLQPGDTAPGFSLAATLGESVSLADYRGKKQVVLAFFPKAFTGG